MSESRQRGNRQQGGDGTEFDQSGGNFARKAQEQLSHLKDNPQVQKGFQQASSLYNKACDQCGQLQRDYPLMSIGLLVLTAFCIGLTIPVAINHFSPQARFHRDNIAAHDALDEVLMRYYNLKGKGQEYTDAAKDYANDKLKNLDSAKDAAKDYADAAKGYAKDKLKDAGSLKDAASQKLADAVYFAKHGKLPDHSLSGRLSNVVKQSLESALGLRDNVYDAAHDLSDKLLHREKETGLKGAIHRAEDKISELIHGEK